MKRCCSIPGLEPQQKSADHGPHQFHMVLILLHSDTMLSSMLIHVEWCQVVFVGIVVVVAADGCCVGDVAGNNIPIVVLRLVE